MMQLSMFEGAKSNVQERLETQDFLDKVKNGFWASQIIDLRKTLKEHGKDAYNEEKKKLFAVTLSGVFKDRQDTSLVRYSGLIQGDIDNVKNVPVTKWARC